MQGSRRVVSLACIGDSPKELQVLGILQLAVLGKIHDLILDRHLAHAEAELDVFVREAESEVAREKIYAVLEAICRLAFFEEQPVIHSVKLLGIRLVEGIDLVGPQYVVTKILPRLKLKLANDRGQKHV